MSRVSALLQLIFAASVILNWLLLIRHLLLTNRPGRNEQPAPRTELPPPLLGGGNEAADVNVTEKLTIGGKPCVTEDNERLLQHLHNVVLIININYDKVGLKIADFLRQVYGRFFLDTVLIGPNEVPEVNIEARGHLGLRHLWPYAYFHLPSIMVRYPEAEGFLWTNDDVTLNYWNFLEADKSKLWLPETPECPSCHHFVPFQVFLPEEVPDGWSANPQTRFKAVSALSSCEPGHIVQYQKSIAPRKEGYMKQVVDCFYIPRQYVEPLSFSLLPVFRDKLVPSEIAIPMMFNALRHPSDYDPIFRRMVYRWERGPRYDPRQFWNSSLGAFHHWKLSGPWLTNTFLETMGSEDGCLKNLLNTSAAATARRS